ncbi:MAG: hypothetical protein KTQ49_01030 [Candidatus Omnitrophica bacterium]|nr:hypothetical protein [Candidatus Omnitrophota bacterium]
MSAKVLILSGVFLWALTAGSLPPGFAADANGSEGSLSPLSPPDDVPLTQGTEAGEPPVPAIPQTGQEEPPVEQVVRDPFQSQMNLGLETGSGPVAAQPVVEVKLQGIGLGPHDSYAVLNGDIYYMEEEQKGIKLLAIRRREVDVLVNGTTQTLRLYDEAARNKALGGRRKSDTSEVVS